MPLLPTHRSEPERFLRLHRRSVLRRARMLRRGPLPLAALIRALFRNGEQGAWLDPSDATTLFQDRTGASATTPAIPGDPVGTILDKSGNGKHALAPTDSARPVYGRVPATGRRNMLPNNRLDGAAVGVVGSGGALPTGWGLGAGSVEVLEISERDGFPFMRFRLTLDNTAGGSTLFPYIRPQPSGSIVYNSGETWTASMFAASKPQAANTVSTQMRIITSFPIASPAGFTFNNTDYAFRSITGSTTSGTVEAIRFEFGADVPAGEMLDTIFEIAVPQLEKSATATAVQITGAGGFDVTEAGVRELRYLRSNGVDSVLEFPSGTLVYGPSEAWLGYRYEAGSDDSAGFRNEGSAGSQNRFQVAHGRIGFGGTSTFVEPRVVGEDYVIGASVAGVGTTTETAFRTGSDPVTQSATRAGVSDTLRLFGFSPVYAQMRFYGGIVINRVFTDKERDAVQRYLAQRSGVDYP